MRKRGAKPGFWILIALLVLGSALRVWRIGFNPLWFDEAFSRDAAVGLDAHSIVVMGLTGDVHPPLYLLLLHAWTELTGDSVVALRMLSALTMILTLPAIYQLGRTLFGTRTGAIALALACIAPFQVYFAHEARQYALSVFFAAWTLVGLARALNGHRRGWWLYAAAGLGGLYTLYFNALLLAVIPLWLLISRQARRAMRGQWRAFIAAHLLIGVGFIPQAITFFVQARTVLSTYWIAAVNPAGPLATLAFLLFSTTLPAALGMVAIVLVVCWLAVAALDLRRHSQRIWFRWLMCVFLLLAPLGLVLALSLGRRSLYLDRSFSLLSPLLVVALAAGLAYARPPSPVRFVAWATAALMVIGLLSHALTPDAGKPPFDQVAAYLTAPERAAIPILNLHDSSYLPVAYYATGQPLTMALINLENRTWLLPGTWTFFGVNRISRADLSQILNAYTGAIQIVATGNMEAPEVATLADVRARACSETVENFGQVVVFELRLGKCS